MVGTSLSEVETQQEVFAFENGHKMLADDGAILRIHPLKSWGQSETVGERLSEGRGDFLSLHLPPFPSRLEFSKRAAR